MLTAFLRSRSAYIYIIIMTYAVHRERAKQARVYACQRTHRRRCITMASLRYRGGRPPYRRCGTKCNMYGGHTTTGYTYST